MRAASFTIRAYLKSRAICPVLVSWEIRNSPDVVGRNCLSRLNRVRDGIADIAVNPARDRRDRSFDSMKHVSKFLVSSFVSGLLILAPIYLSGLLLLRAMQAVGGLVQPIANLLPEWFPAQQVLSLLFVLIVCLLIGVAVRTQAGRAAREQIEKSLFEKIPGYALFRSLTQQLAGSREETVWKPALVEIEEALVPAFIIEEFEDGRFTVFVPSAPTPLSGSVYILTPERVHPIDVPFTLAIKSLSRWGSGSKELVAAMENRRKSA
jgi:uncharacterized membrane protein